MPSQIAKFEAEKAEIERVLANPDLVADDRTRFQSYMTRHGELVEALAAAEERWLALANAPRNWPASHDQLTEIVPVRCNA